LSRLSARVRHWRPLHQSPRPPAALRPAPPARQPTGSGGRL